MDKQQLWRLRCDEAPYLDVTSDDPQVLLQILRDVAPGEIFTKKGDLWDRYYNSRDVMAEQPTREQLLEALDDDFESMDALSQLHLALQSQYASAYTLSRVGSQARMPAIYASLLYPLLGKDELVHRWWCSANKAFDGFTPAQMHSAGGESEKRLADYVMAQVFR